MVVEWNQRYDQSNAAMSSAKTPNGTILMGVEGTPKGGIDFKSDKVGKVFAVRNSGGEIKFRIDPAMLQQLRNAPGFTPVIINIQLMGDIRGWLGINDLKSTKETATL